MRYTEFSIKYTAAGVHNSKPNTFILQITLGKKNEKKSFRGKHDLILFFSLYFKNDSIKCLRKTIVWTHQADYL